MKRRGIELNEEQIEKLYVFVKNKFVQYYDVQVELVDHLATAIEEKLQENQDKDFDEALKEVYTSFGPLGFTEFMESKTQSVHKNAQRLWRDEFLLWFRWPKMLMSLVLTMGVYALLTQVRADYFIYSSSIFFILFFALLHFSGRGRMGMQAGYSLLVMNPFSFMLFSWAFIIGFFPFYITQFVTGSDIPTVFPGWVNGVLAVWVSLGILFIVSSFVVRGRVLEKSQVLYPEVFSISVKGLP